MFLDGGETLNSWICTTSAL